MSSSTLALRARFLMSVRKGPAKCSCRWHSNPAVAAPAAQRLKRSEKDEQESSKHNITGKKPTADTIRQFGQMAKGETRALMVALGAVGIGTGTTVVFPFAIGKIMDAMNVRSSKISMESDSDVMHSGPGNMIGARDFIEQCFTSPPAWLVDMVPPDLSAITALSLGLVGVYAVGALATFVRNTAVNLAGERIAARLRKRVFAAIMRRDIAFFDRTRTGELMNRLSTDVTQVSKCLSEDFSSFVRSFAQGAGALGAMLYTSPQLCGVMLCVIPPVAMWAAFFGRRVRALSKKVLGELAEAGSLAEERLSNVRTVRALGNDELEVSRYAHQVNHVFRIAKHQSLLQGIYYGVVMGSGNLGLVLVLYRGGEFVNMGLITIGDLSTMLLYSVYAAFSTTALFSFYGELQKASGAADRIFDLMDADKHERPTYIEQQKIQHLAAGPSQAKGPIVFKDVHFAYPTRSHFPVFKGLDMTVQENEVLALVGPSGCGKSTLAALLMRMYESDRGEILLNGQTPIQDIAPQRLRKEIAYVTQDAVLFSGTVRDNLMLGFSDLQEDQEKMKIDHGLRLWPIKEPPEDFTYAAKNWNVEERMERMREACRLANCLEFIERWDDGFDTVIGERGAQLSGGQRARLAMARAILRDSKILLLDEVSAALDSASEAALHSALMHVLQGRTAIMIAHRWSSIQFADRVAVLGDGKIVEMGTQNDLLSANGAFRKLVEPQLAPAA